VENAQRAEKARDSFVAVSVKEKEREREREREREPKAPIKYDLEPFYSVNRCSRLGGESAQMVSACMCS
jgi:hypothetical protein